MRTYFSCLRCGWGVFGSYRRYEGACCPECGGGLLDTSGPEKEVYKGGLSVRPSIMERITAALNEPYEFQVVYYNRREGASSAAIELALTGKNIAILSSAAHHSQFRRKRAPFFDYNKCIPDGMSNMTIIADVVPEQRLSEWCSVLLRNGAGNKIIAIKAILREG